MNTMKFIIPHFNELSIISRKLEIEITEILFFRLLKFIFIFTTFTYYLSLFHVGLHTLLKHSN